MSTHSRALTKAVLISCWLLVTPAVFSATIFSSMFDEEVVVMPKATIKMSPEQFRRAFNLAMVEIESSYQLSGAFYHLRDDKEENLRHVIRPGISFKLVVAPNGELERVQINSSGSGDQQDLFKPLKIFLGAAQAINVNPVLKDQGRIIALMCDQAISEMDRYHAVERDVGSFRYSVSARRVDGLTFTIEPLSE